ncbi:MAG: M50 family metallopeptidase [Candidatus Limnocylindrales bacterium]
MPQIVNSAIDWLVLLAMLVVLVVIHEFGHFIVARRAGVRVHEFGIGFPPRAKVLHRGPETVFTLNWVPLGGFVKLEGEEGESNDPRAFVNQRLRTRVVILLAGVVMNLLLAGVLMSTIAMIGDPSTVIGVAALPATPDGSPSPAQAAGLVIGDEILSIDGQTAAWFDGPDAQLKTLRARGGQTIDLVVRHADGSRSQVRATLNTQAAIDAGQGALGIRFSLSAGPSITRDPITALGIGTRRTVEACTLILVAVRDFVTDITHPQVSGPIGIVSAVGTVRAEPPVFLIYLLALLSANLAIVNALPLPPLDGGRVAVAIIKRVAGSRLSVSAERATYAIGFTLLMAFIVYISIFDIARSAGGSP